MTAATERVHESPIAQAMVKAAVSSAQAAAADPKTPLSQDAVRASTGEIREAMTHRIASSPELQHVTNSEAWYQKRSRWSAIIGTVAPVVGLGLKAIGVEWEFGVGEQVAVTDALMGIGGLWAAFLALRAGLATKPLGA